jgi:ParB/RepB/Spo0J family partition protein
MSTAVDVRSISRTLLTPSPLNPRTKFKKSDLDDLAASIKAHGIIQALVVRPAASGNGYEIVCGERRWRASEIAGLKELPANVRADLDDKTVVELSLAENLERKDMHALDEAKGFEELLQLDKQATAASIAAKFGVSERYVQNRLHYRELEKAVREAFYEDRITSGHADLIVRLEKAEQRRALEACFTEVFDYDDNTIVDPDEPGARREPIVRLISVRELDRWIRGSIRIPTAAQSPKLEMFPEVQQAVAAVAAAPKAERQPLLELTDAYHIHGKMDPLPILQSEWKAVGKKRCEHARRGVIVIGSRQGQVLDVCLKDSKCTQHWPPAPKAARPAAGETLTSTGETRKLSTWELQAKAKQAAGRRWGRIRKLAIAAAKKAAAGVTLPKALPVLAYGLKPWSTPPPVLEKLVAYVLDHKTDYADRAAFQKHIAGPLGVNLKAIEAQVFPKKAKKAKPAKKGKRKIGLSATPPKGEARPLGTKAKGGRRRKAGKKR